MRASRVVNGTASQIAGPMRCLNTLPVQPKKTRVVKRDGTEKVRGDRGHRNGARRDRYCVPRYAEISCMFSRFTTAAAKRVSVNEIESALTEFKDSNYNVQSMNRTRKPITPLFSRYGVYFPRYWLLALELTRLLGSRQYRRSGLGGIPRGLDCNTHSLSRRYSHQSDHHRPTTNANRRQLHRYTLRRRRRH